MGVDGCGWVWMGVDGGGWGWMGVGGCKKITLSKGTKTRPFRRLKMTMYVL